MGSMRRRLALKGSFQQETQASYRAHGHPRALPATAAAHSLALLAWSCSATARLHAPAGEEAAATVGWALRSWARGASWACPHQLSAGS